MKSKQLISTTINPTSYNMEVKDELFETTRRIDHKNQLIIVYNDCDYSYTNLINDLSKIDFNDLSKKLHFSINHALEIDSFYATWNDLYMVFDEKFHKFFTLKLMIIHEFSRDQKIFTKILNHLKSRNIPIMVESIMNKSLYRHLLDNGFIILDQYHQYNLYYIPEGYYENPTHHINPTSSHSI